MVLLVVQGIGKLFNLETDVLETITVQYRQDKDKALMEVIRKWFQTHHNPGWEGVEDVHSNLKQIIIRSAGISF